MDTALWITQFSLAGMFIILGGFKLFAYERARASLPWSADVSRGFVQFIGACELLGGLGLVLPALTGIHPRLTPLAALGIALLLIFATAFHLRRSELARLGITLPALAAALFVLWGRW